MIQTLMSVTVDFLQQLVREYESGRVNAGSFHSHAKEKVEFLQKHKSKVFHSHLRQTVEETIQVCQGILNSKKG